MSLRTDLTACVAAYQNPETLEIHLEPHCFTPLTGLPQRQIRDKVPYDAWIRDGYLIGVPGPIISLEWVADYCRTVFEGCQIKSVEYDRYRIELFQAAADAQGFTGMVAEWVPVGQGFVSMAPRVEAFEAEALAGRIRHGGHPLLNAAFSTAITAHDAAGNRKLDKSKSTHRIDPAVAALMAVFPLSDGFQQQERIDVEAMIA